MSFYPPSHFRMMWTLSGSLVKLYAYPLYVVPKSMATTTVWLCCGVEDVSADTPLSTHSKWSGFRCSTSDSCTKLMLALSRLKLN